uniref:Uncharacterized protein n=1 Tax=Neobodo designis TaxID=312471 RepID=A0A7S1QSD3_NEODS|mmetsp:Transcript_5140/g.16313  ORF Transcript_5140/g.16313 Transcript_5140/m.16313 type:complete len:365 (+) Transcript_5140:41-1135(+)
MSTATERALKRLSEQQARRFRKLCRKRRGDLGFCRWAQGRGGYLFTPALRFDAAGALYARTAIPFIDSSDDRAARHVDAPNCLVSIPMSTSLGITHDDAAPDVSAANAMGSSGATPADRTIGECLALTRSVIAASLDDTSPSHPFARAFVRRSVERAAALSNAQDGLGLLDDDFVDDGDVDDADVAMDQEDSDTSSTRPPSLLDGAVYCNDRSNREHPAVSVFAERVQRAADAYAQSAVEGVVSLVHPVLAGVLGATVVDHPLPFELVPFADRVTPARDDDDANVELGAFIDLSWQPHFEFSATRDIAAGEHLRVNLHRPVSGAPPPGRDPPPFVTTGTAWEPLSREEQLWVRFGLTPARPGSL